jgi:polyhydroxyalkanoate synthase
LASRADELRHARTRDGWRIAVHHWRPVGAARAAPVLLCHGLASNAATWDLGAGPSFARYLAGRGHPVYALELRGAGASDGPRLGGARGYSWGAHEYVTEDVPAAIEHVLSRTGKERLHFIGHSMGGILLLALAPLPLAARFETAVVVGTALDYTKGSDFGQLKGLAGFLRLVRAIPVGTAARAYARFAGASPFDDFMFAPENLALDEKRAIWREVFTWVPGLVLRELATTFDRGGFRGRDGRLWVEGLKSIATPLLMVAGTRDRQCPVAAARATFEKVGSARKELLVAPGLGHFDLLVGSRAEREIYPAIARWIEA